ncbi:MAG: class I SAM-dependent methyltransferase [Hyphomicrobiaceae bacterium]|nr:class I SAM-dependent methyltransferase [Hyphomicrobiaceae bacterium]
MTSVHRAATEGFSKGAETYRQGRPEYPAEVATWLAGRLGLGPGRKVLDLGAGTGKFTKALVATGATVEALDPVPEMLARLSVALPPVVTMAGSAEAIPREDASYDAVLCAQSFHWFATTEALAEIRRVLKPGGHLGLIWNVRDHDVPWVAQFTATLDAYNTDGAPRHYEGAWRAVFPARGFTPLDEEVARQRHTGASEDVILKRGLSVSFVAALPPATQQEIAAKVRGLIADTPELAGRDEVTFPYVTRMFAATRCEAMEG